MSNENVYGIYQSHGALQISNSEESLNAYDVQHGWDWTRVPGTTTIKLSLHKMVIPNFTSRYYQPSKLVGGVVLTSKDTRLANGVFAMKFHQPLYGSRDGITAGYGRKRTINGKPVSTVQCTVKVLVFFSMRANACITQPYFPLKVLVFLHKQQSVNSHKTPHMTFNFWPDTYLHHVNNVAV